jgi:hypothetical protein
VNTIGNIFDPALPSLVKWISSHDDVLRALWTQRGLDGPRRPFIGSLRGWKMRERNGVFDQFAALCIADLDWLRDDAFQLVILDAEQLLVDGDADELSPLLDILRDAAESMLQPTSFGPAKPFRVLLACKPGARWCARGAA